MKRGLAALAALYGVTVLAWLVSRPEVPTTAASERLQLYGLLALAGLAATMAIATRARVLDRLFGGLDRAYGVHAWLGISSIGLVLLHLVSRRPGGQREAGELDLIDLGLPALVLFVVLGLVAMVGPRLRHEAWKAIHALMAVAYLIALVHYYGSSSYGAWGTAPISVWMNLVNAAGLACGLYSTVLYERVAFRSAFEVTGTRAVGQGNLEVTGRPTGRPARFRAGQFAFVTFPDLRWPSHPFTISSAPGDASIQFTIRALGDHTAALPSRITPGARLAVSSPHGAFDFTTGTHHQIWVAAGIGITPFRSFLRAGVPPEFSVDLFYAYHGESGAYLDELAAAPGHVQVHLVDSARGDRLTAAAVARTVRWTTPGDLYFCGPSRMRRSLASGLRAERLPVARLRYERFVFGRRG